MNFKAPFTTICQILKSQNTKNSISNKAIFSKNTTIKALLPIVIPNSRLFSTIHYNFRSTKNSTIRYNLSSLLVILIPICKLFSNDYKFIMVDSSVPSWATMWSQYLVWEFNAKYNKAYVYCELSSIRKVLNKGT